MGAWVYTGRNLARQLSVVVLVIARENLGKFRDFAALLPIAIGFPTVHKNAVAVDYRYGLELPRHAAHPPQFLARLKGVRGDFEGAGDDQLRRPTSWTVDRGRGITARVFRPHRLPEHPPSRGIDSDQVRPGVLIADEHQLSIGEDWRGAVAVWIVERTQRQTPALVAIRSVGQHPEVAKEHVNIASICDCRWRRGSVRLLETLHAWARRPPPP